MPVFKFACASCKTEIRQLIRTSTIERILCRCGEFMERQLPTSIAAVTKEMRDPHRGVSLPKGQEQQMRKRMSEHHDRHEVEEKIDRFGEDTAKRLGWDKKVRR